MSDAHHIFLIKLVNVDKSILYFLAMGREGKGEGIWRSATNGDAVHTENCSNIISSFLFVFQSFELVFHLCNSVTKTCYKSEERQVCVYA